MGIMGWSEKGINQSQCSAQGQVFTANSAFSTLPSSQPSFSYLHTVHYHDVVYHLISSYAANLPFYHSFQSILQQAVPSKPVAQPISFPLLYQFQHYSSFSQAFQHNCIFLFCLSILCAPSCSIPTSQMLPGVFAHSVVVSKSLHHTTLHSIQSTSLVSFQGPPENASLPFSIPTPQMLPVVFAHCAAVSKSLLHTTLHSTQSTSLISTVVLFPRAPENASFPVKGFFYDR